MMRAVILPGLLPGLSFAAPPAWDKAMLEQHEVFMFDVYPPTVSQSRLPFFRDCRERKASTPRAA